MRINNIFNCEIKLAVYVNKSKTITVNLQPGSYVYSYENLYNKDLIIKLRKKIVSCETIENESSLKLNYGVVNTPVINYNPSLIVNKFEEFPEGSEIDSEEPDFEDFEELNQNTPNEVTDPLNETKDNTPSVSDTKEPNSNFIIDNLLYISPLYETSSTEEKSQSDNIESIPAKNKGGRPKGSFKKKLGRPKTKKPPGRPKKKEKVPKNQNKNLNTDNNTDTDTNTNNDNSTTNL